MLDEARIELTGYGKEGKRSVYRDYFQDRYRELPGSPVADLVVISDCKLNLRLGEEVSVEGQVDER
jgi:hypothetical protein